MTLNNYSGENVSMHAFNFPIFCERPLVSNKEKLLSRLHFKQRAVCGHGLKTEESAPARLMSLTLVTSVVTPTVPTYVIPSTILLTFTEAPVITPFSALLTGGALW